MNTSNRFPPLLATVLVLGATAVTLAGCGSSSSRELKTLRELRNRAVAVNVVIVYNPDTKQGEFLAPSDKLIEISEGFKDYVQWVSPDGLVFVHFKDGSPFDKDPVHERKVLKSRPARKGTAGTGFSYTAELELFDAAHTRVSVADPRIEVMP
jgi:hypothetical protein